MKPGWPGGRRWRSNPAQQFRLLGVELVVAEDAAGTQIGEPLDGREDVAVRAGGCSLRTDMRSRRCRRLGRAVLRRKTASRDDRQRADVDEPELAGEGQRSVDRLLLREAADLMIERVVDRHRAVDVDRKPARLREIRVAGVVLRAGAV